MNNTAVATMCNACTKTATHHEYKHGDRSFIWPIDGVPVAFKRNQKPLIVPWCDDHANVRLIEVWGEKE